MRKATVVRDFDLDGFLQLWAVYPKKAAKKDAYKAWCQLRPSAALRDQILCALSWQCHQYDWTKQDGAFVPLLASYLRGERWTDERRNLATRPAGINKTTRTVLDALNRDETYD